MNKYLLVIFCFFAYFSFSQSRQLKKAESSFNSLHYAKAVKHYEKYINKSGDSTLLNKLAFSYYKKGDYNKAYYNFNLWESLEKNNLNSFTAEELYLYAVSALSLKTKDRYDSIISNFVSMHPTDSRALFHTKRSLLEKYKTKFKTRYVLTPFELNSEYSDFGFYAQNDKNFFVSKRAKTKLDYWSSKYFSSLYTYNNKEKLIKPNPIKFSLRSDFKAHQSTAALNSTGDQLYLTQSAQNSQGESYLQIIRYNLNKEGKWHKPELLSINRNEYNNAHPSIDKAGKMLYFSSDRPGGYGLSDLYRVEIKADGSLADPVNLGPKINTASRESFPFIDDNYNLYFASDGHPSYGGLDIFGIAINDPYAMTFNLGKPLNNVKDDFAYFSADGKTYISSNREGGQGSDDIYKVEIENPIVFDCFGSVSGLVVNKQTNKPVINAQIEVLDDMLQVKVVQTSKNGFYHIEDLECGKQYNLRITEENHKVSTKKIDISRVYDHGEIATIALNPKVTIEGQLADIVNNNRSKDREILYGFDKKQYLPEGETVVRELAELLKENPSQQLVIESYTDPSGPDVYNKWLSQERSDFIKNKLIAYGVDSEQLVSLGKGEFVSSADCMTANCNYSNSKQRRTEFKLANTAANTNVTSIVTQEFKDINFAFDSVFYFKESANETINAVASYLLQNKNAGILLTGHSDSVGNADYNMSLSKKRAENIKASLIRKGIASSRIEIIAKGETQLLNDCSLADKCTQEQHRINRRVELLIQL